MKKIKHEFCMSEFKPAIGALTILVVVVIGWSIWNLKFDKHRGEHNLSLTAAAAVTPPAKDIMVKDKMLHPYWGNCNKCHITIDAPTQSVSKVFAGPPISITQKQLHKYWGNCNLCHQVTDGFQPPADKTKTKLAALGILPVALGQVTADTLGIKVQAVNAAQMRQMGLVNEDGALVLDVTPGSPADQAGLRKGDEIIRIDNTRVENMIDFNAAMSLAQPGRSLKVNLYRGKKSRNFFVKVPDVPGNNANFAATTPMTQNQIETQAEQLGVPKTQQAVQQALQPNQPVHMTTPFGMGIGNGQLQMINTPGAGQQAHHLPAPFGMGIGNGQMQMINTPAAVLQQAALPASGKVAVAIDGQHISSQVFPLFGTAPYFLIFDPGKNTYQVVGNPNFNDTTGRGIQTGQFMADQEVSNVIAGQFGHEAYTTLRTLRINMYSGVTGSASDALALYSTGRLQPTTMAPTTMMPAAAAPPQNQGAAF